MGKWFDEEVGKVTSELNKLRRSADMKHRQIVAKIEAFIEALGNGLHEPPRAFMTKQFQLEKECSEQNLDLPLLKHLHCLQQPNLWYCFPDSPNGFEPSDLRSVFTNSCTYVDAARALLGTIKEDNFRETSYQKWFGGSQFDENRLRKIRVKFLMIQHALKKRPVILAKMPAGRGFDDAFGAAMRRGEVVKLAFNKSATLNVVYVGNVFWSPAADTTQAELDLNFGNDNTQAYAGYLKEHTIIHEMSHLAANTKDVTTTQCDPSKLTATVGQKGERLGRFLKNREKLKKYGYTGHDGSNVETFYGSPLSKILARANPDLAADNADNFAYFSLECGVPGVRARFVKRDVR